MRAAVFVVSLALLGLAAGDRINDLPTLRRQLQGKHGKTNVLGVPSVTIGSVQFPTAQVPVSIPTVTVPSVPNAIIVRFRRSVLQFFKDNFVSVNVQISNPTFAVDGVVSGLVPQLTKFFADAFVDVRETLAKQGITIDADFSGVVTTELLEALEAAFSEAMTTTIPGFTFPNNFPAVFGVLPGRVINVITTSPIIFTANPASIAGLVRRPFTLSLREIFKNIAPRFGTIRTSGATVVTGSGPSILVGSASAGKAGPGVISLATGGSLGSDGGSVTVSTNPGPVPQPAPAPVPVAPVAAPVAPVAAPVVAPVATPSNTGSVTVTTSSSQSSPQGVSTVTTGGPGQLPATPGSVTVQTISPGSSTTITSSSTSGPTGNSGSVSGTGVSTSTTTPVIPVQTPTGPIGGGKIPKIFPRKFAKTYGN